MKTITKPFINYNDRQQWEEGLKALDSGAMVEMCEDAFNHFLNCVPPRRMQSTSFVCGEPNDCNSKGENIYLCAIKKGGKYYAQHGTVKQYDKRNLFKTN